MRRAEIIKDVEGTIYFDIPQGRPSAYTVSITKPSGTAMPTAVDGATATLDSVNTTVSAYSSSTPRQITLTSVANIVIGREYLITNAVGESAFVEIKSIDTSGKIVYLFGDMPLDADLAASDTFVSTRIGYTVVVANTATADLNYVVTWNYTVGSTDYQRTDTFDVVRNIPYRVATSEGFRRYNSDLADRFEAAATDGQDWDERLESAFDIVLFDIEQRGKGSRANALIDMKSLEYATYERVLLTLADAGYAPPNMANTGIDFKNDKRADYNLRLSQALQHIRWLDADEDLKVDSGSEENVNRGFSRIVR